MLNALLNRRSGIFFFSSAMIIMDDGGGGKGGKRKRETDRKRREEWNTGLHRTLTLYSLCKDCTSIRMILRYKKKNVPSFLVNEKRSFFFFFLATDIPWRMLGSPGADHPSHETSTLPSLKEDGRSVSHYIFWSQHIYTVA